MHYIHARVYKDERINQDYYFHPSSSAAHPQGGFTIAYDVVGEDSNAVEVSYSLAVCSDKDRFNRSIGRQVSEGRHYNGQFGTLTLKKQDVTRDNTNISWSMLAEAIFNQVVKRIYTGEE